jgi:hypothetical protein
MTTYYVLTVEGGVSIEKHGPFTLRKDRDAMARTEHQKQDQDTDSVFWMNVTTKPDDPSLCPVVIVGEYSAAFFEETT